MEYRQKNWSNDEREEHHRVRPSHSVNIDQKVLARIPIQILCDEEEIYSREEYDSNDGNSGNLEEFVTRIEREHMKEMMASIEEIHWQILNHEHEIQLQPEIVHPNEDTELKAEEAVEEPVECEEEEQSEGQDKEEVLLGYLEEEGVGALDFLELGVGEGGVVGQVDLIQPLQDGIVVGDVPHNLLDLVHHQQNLCEDARVVTFVIVVHLEVVHNEVDSLQDFHPKSVDHHYEGGPDLHILAGVTLSFITQLKLSETFIAVPIQSVACFAFNVAIQFAFVLNTVRETELLSVNIWNQWNV